MGYKTFYELSKEEKAEIFANIEYQHGLPSFAVEKDWWVVRCLDVLFQSSVKEVLVFKGGTSLSKAWGVLDRFSEDIDLAIDRSFFGFDGEISNRAIGRLREASKKFIEGELLPEITKQFEADGLEVNLYAAPSEQDIQDPVTLFLEYPVSVEYDTYVEPLVKIEIGSRSLIEPFENRSVISLVGEFFSDQEFADDSIEVPTVTVERTFLDKLFLLHEVTQLERFNKNPGRLSRHMYDIHMMMLQEIEVEVFKDLDLIKNIIEHRSKFYKINQVDYGNHHPPNLKPNPSEEFIGNWRDDYRAMNENMIYGDKSIDFDELCLTLEAIAATYNLLEL